MFAEFGLVVGFIILVAVLAMFVPLMRFIYHIVRSVGPSYFLFKALKKGPGNVEYSDLEPILNRVNLSRRRDDGVAVITDLNLFWFEVFGGYNGSDTAEFCYLINSLAEEKFNHTADSRDDLVLQVNQRLGCVRA